MLLWYELKKTLFSRALIGFVVLSLAMNFFIMFAYGYTYRYTERESEPFNIFEGYDANALADYYVGLYGMTGRAEENIRAKYSALQPVIDEKAANGDALSVYFGTGTYDIHEFLFGKLLFAIIAQAALLAMFAALMSTGYEGIRNTEQLVCSSKIGRKITRTKFAASLIAGLVFFAAILIISLGVFFLRYDYSAVWNDNVSSSFNYWVKPFITWHNFTVSQFLWATIGAAAGLTVVFGLFGYAIGTFFRSVYKSCGVAVALCVLQFLAMMLFPIGGTIRGALNLTPVMLWMNASRSRWFTEGGAEIIWAHFETIGLTACFILLAAASVIAVQSYKRRDLL